MLNLILSGVGWARPAERFMGIVGGMCPPYLGRRRFDILHLMELQPAGDADAAMVRRAQAGDASAFAELSDAYRDRLLAFARRHCSREADAEDIVQNTLLKVWRSLPNYQPQENAKFSTWLFQICRNESIDRHRRSKGEKPLPEDHADRAGGETPPEALYRQEVASAVRAAIVRLGEPCQTSLSLVLDGAETEEIAKRMPPPPSEVHKRLHRCKQKLKELLQGFATP